MATEAKQLVILQRLTTLLEGIVTPAYAYNLVGKVYRGRLLFGEEVVTPYLSIIEATRNEIGPTAAENDRLGNHQWPLLVQGWVDDDKINPTDAAYRLKATVTDRLSAIIDVDGRNGNPKFPAFYMLGNLITSMSVGLGVVRPPDGQLSDKAWFYLPVTIGISVDIRNGFITS